MKKKKILLSTVLLAVLLAVMALCIALFSNTEEQETEASAQTEQSGETGVQSDEQSSQSVEQSVVQPSQSEEERQSSVCEEGIFTFTAGQFAERFADTLPAGYCFADAATANPSRDHRMQIDILDSTGAPVDIEILLDVQETESAFNQMALVIKEEGYEEDASAILQWYVSTFFEGFDAQEQEVIYEDFLDMFNIRSEEYGVYAGDILAAMMCRETEDSGRYYYVLISVQ